MFRKYYYPLFLSLMVAALSLASCECMHHVRGVVLDKETKKPIDSVFILPRRNLYAITNAAGEFKLDAMTPGITGCKPLSITITKGGYHILYIEVYNNLADTIYLEKVK